MRSIAFLLLITTACSDDAGPHDGAAPTREHLAIQDQAPSTPRPIGSACARDSDCQHNHCLIQRGAGVFPDGYCSKDCDPITAPCPAGASCAGTVDGDCFKICTTAADCRTGYSCKEGPGGGPPQICFPD